MFNSLLNSVSGSPWTYLLIVGVCAGDAVLPLFPSETVVITAAVLSLGAVIAGEDATAAVSSGVSWGVLGDWVAVDAVGTVVAADGFRAEPVVSILLSE